MIKIKAIIFDLDDTLYPNKNKNIKLKDSKELLNNLSKKYKVGILSNSNSFEVANRIKKLGVEFPYRSRKLLLLRKPLPFGLNALLKELGVSKNEAIIVGDKIITDFLLGLLSRTPKVILLGKKEKDCRLFWTSLKIITNLNKLEEIL